MNNINYYRQNEIYRNNPQELCYIDCDQFESLLDCVVSSDSIEAVSAIKRIVSKLRGKPYSIECERGDYILVDAMGYKLAGDTPRQILLYCIREGILKLEEIVEQRDQRS